MGVKIITVSFDDYGIKEPSYTLVVNDGDVIATIEKLRKADQWKEEDTEGTHRFEVHEADSLDYVIGELKEFHDDLEANGG